MLFVLLFPAMQMKINGKSLTLMLSYHKNAPFIFQMDLFAYLRSNFKAIIRFRLMNIINVIGVHENLLAIEFT